MEIKTEDLNDLSTILDQLNKGKSVDRDFMISSGLIENDLHNREKTREMARIRLNYLIPIREYYCAVKQEVGRGFDIYMVKPDINKSSRFYAKGGFVSEYSRQQASNIKAEEKEKLSIEIDRLTIDNLKYHKKMRKWQILAGLGTIIGTILGLLIG